MKVSKFSELSDRVGDVLMLYGDPGVGKSVTTIQTAEAPILYIMTEPRDVKKFVMAAQRPGIEEQIDFAFYDGWDSMIEFICKPGTFDMYRTVVVDSISHLIAINLSDEILGENYDAASSKSNKKSEDKPLTMRTKMSQEGYGTLGSQMLRFTQAIAKISQNGKTVVCLARAESNPKYNRALSAAPALKGQEYSKHFAGFFDFIGLVEQRSDKDGLIVYPPSVSFESDGSFLAKWTGMRPNGGTANRTLNIHKILQASYGMKTNGKGEQ